MPPATTSSQAMQNLQQFQSGAKPADQLLQDQEQQLGVTSAQQQVQGLRGAIQNTTHLLDQVAPGVMGRTQNSLVTDSQANRIIQNEQAPIQTNLAKDTQDYNDANTQYTDLKQEAESRANAALSDQQNRLSYLQNIYNDLYGQEQNSAQMAEAKREFDANQATARASAAASMASPSFGSLLSSAASGGGGALSIPNIPTGTIPKQAVGTLFKGYQPGADKYYTEQVVIPALQRLMTANAAATHQNFSQASIASDAARLAYQYRKAAFGE